MSGTHQQEIFLPAELIRHIFSSLSPCEIIKVRQVSRQFRDISLDPFLWKDTYARAPLPRPSGPFPWQSILYLERTLVQSDLLSKTWVSQPAKLTLRKSSSQWNLCYAINILLGRWCIWMERNNIYCRNIDTGNSQMLYDGSGDVEFFYEMFPRSGWEGERVYVVLTDDSYPYQFLRLLEFNVNEHCFSAPRIRNLLHPESQRSADSLTNEEDHLHGPSPFLILRAIHHPSVVLDLRTRGLYTLPRFTGGGLDVFSSFPALDIWRRTTTLLVPTRTHIVAFQVVDAPDAVVVVFQAFVSPDPPPSSNLTNLRLTHQAIFTDEERLEDGTVDKPDFPFSDTTLLRNSVVDPVTGSINIKILYASHTLPPVNTRVSFLDLTLPESSSPDILPIHIRREHLFKSLWISRRFTASEDGHARGILISYMGDPYQFAIRKFAIDASGDMCAVKFSESSSVAVPFHIDWNEVVFNGITGTLHYLNTIPHVHLMTIDIV